MPRFTEYLMLVALLAALPKTTWAIDAGCDFYQDVEAGKIYYVYNPEYPNPYTTPKTCRWYVKSPTKVKLTCQTFSLPASTNCAGDRLSVSVSGDRQLADARNYCGNETIDITSIGNTMNIVLTALPGTTGGKFLCSLQVTASAVPNCDCGWKKQSTSAGGTSTGVNEYSMMARIVNLDQVQLACDGAIISTRHVLCAAHCRQPRTSPVQYAVLVGDHDIATGTGTAASSVHLVSTFDHHPSYDPNFGLNDIAVIKVIDMIVFTMEVGPACLPFEHSSDIFVGSTLDLLSWGRLEFGGTKSNVLKKVELDVIQVSTCQQKYPAVTNNQLCTHTREKDACQFDSGGSLFWQTPNTKRLVLVGVPNYGRTCGDDIPSVNTRVGAYMDWILSVTPGVNYCRVA